MLKYGTMVSDVHGIHENVAVTSNGIELDWMIFLLIKGALC